MFLGSGPIRNGTSGPGGPTDTSTSANGSLSKSNLSQWKSMESLSMKEWDSGPNKVRVCVLFYFLTCRAVIISMTSLLCKTLNKIPVFKSLSNNVGYFSFNIKLFSFLCSSSINMLFCTFLLQNKQPECKFSNIFFLFCHSLAMPMLLPEFLTAHTPPFRWTTTL